MGACTCDEKAKPVDEREWRVTHFKHNHSPANVCQETYSEYSEIVCLSCNGRWRTRASYATLLELHENHNH